MEVDYKFYYIDIADIWQYEHNQFLSNKSSDDLAKQIINKVESLIIKEGEVSFIVNLDSNESRAYYERNIKDYKKSSNTLKGRFETNYFFNKGSCYEFDQHIIIKKDNPDFDFWFALKLRQYDSKLIELKNFLEFHLEDTFNKDFIKFIDFIKLEMKQFRDKIFNDGITETVDSWIKEKNSINRKIKGRYASLRLKELTSNPNYFQINKNSFNKAFIQLKENNFIHKDSLFTDFKRIFEDGIVPESKRIIWTGTNKDLQWFMNYLTKGSKKIELHKNDIWVVANKCFVDRQGKEFGIKPLRKANGKDEKRKKVLESILAKI